MDHFVNMSMACEAIDSVEDIALEGDKRTKGAYRALTKMDSATLLNKIVHILQDNGVKFATGDAAEKVVRGKVARSEAARTLGIMAASSLTPVTFIDIAGKKYFRIGDIPVTVAGGERFYLPLQLKNGKIKAIKISKGQMAKFYITAENRLDDELLKKYAKDLLKYAHEETSGDE